MDIIAENVFCDCSPGCIVGCAITGSDTWVLSSLGGAIYAYAVGLEQ